MPGFASEEGYGYNELEAGGGCPKSTGPWQCLATRGRHLVSPCLALTLVLFSAFNYAQCQPLQTQVKVLTNGIRLAVVYFPASTNVSIFTFSPLGLVSDAAGQAQWTHVVEHLIIRSTVTGELVHANGETLPDHQRLDTYGTVADWKTWLGHHRRWLEGTAFTQVLPRRNSSSRLA